MASSISVPPLYYPDKISRKSLYANPNPRFLNHSLKKLSSSPTDPTTCRCQNGFDSLASPNEGRPRWDSVLQDVAKSAVKWWNDYVNSNGGSLEGADLVGETEAMEEGDWDWERWRRHFEEVEEQERLVSILKSQLADAVYREDYQDAAKLKVANAAAARNDTVGQAISLLNRAVKEERYQDAAFIRDHAGAGLVGWWAGKSEDSTNPYGVVVRISAEHGRYVARSYSSRQFASGTRGIPLFEVYFTVNDGGEYKHQAVYLKQNKRNSVDFLAKSRKPADVSSLNPLGDSNEVKNDLPVSTTDDLEESEERDEDSDVAEGLAGIQSILRDMIPGVKVKVLKVMGPGKVDRDLIFKSLEQDMEEEEDEDDDDDGEEDEELEVVEDSEDELKSEIERDKIIDDGRGVNDREDQSEMSVKVVIGGLVQKLSSDMTPKDILRVPARLESRSHKSFSFCIKKDEDLREKPGKKGLSLQEKDSALPSQRSINLVMSNLVKVLGSRERIPMEVLKNVGELINLTLSQAQNRKPLSGSTIFNRIEIPATSDPLNGLYIGSHGLNTSEIIHLRRKFGHWEEDGGSQKSSNLGFYEYVEALKLTGDPYVPAGQIAFRAKVGKRNQLPHRGIIPEEFGVVARYRGQGRLAEPGFLNPRWVDGELVILDGKHVIGGPVVGFVYWAPEYHFLVFFNRLRLQD